MTRKQTGRWRWLRRVFIALVVVVVASLIVLHLFYPLPYVLAVLVHRGPDFSDIHRFPAREIASAQSPGAWVVAARPDLAEVVELHPEIDDFEIFLDETDTSTFLIVHQRQLVMERYLLGHDRESLQNTFSVSKSIMSAVVGLAVDEGAFTLEDAITTHVPELEERDGRFGRITVEHLLDMRSGIRYSSKIAFPIVNADNPLIYYHPDLASVVLERTEIESSPGAFEYNNYNPPLIGLILRRTTGMPVGEYLERRLWQPLQAEYPAGWTTDKQGFERMESGFHARARDLARFGLLYLDRGQAAGRQVLPGAWVAATTTLPEPVELDTYNGRAWVYRAGWWLVPRPEAPPDFCAIGHFGQFIYVSPQHEAVFVRCGPDRGDWGDYDWTSLFYFLAERL